jgi:Ser/Thr protein kinase RdoA (MazF antagonist)
VHALLHHLERVEFRGAPRALGIDDQGREVLTYIPGPLAHERVLDDAELAGVARLVREYHTAAASFPATAGMVWRSEGRDPSGIHEVVCHNDLAPWNLVVGERERAFIDWDLAAPGRRLWDLALAACTFVPLHPGAARQQERFRLFCNAYGLAATEQPELLTVMVERTRRMWRVLTQNADREPYATLVREGHAEFWRGIEQYIIHDRTSEDHGVSKAR